MMGGIGDASPKVRFVSDSPLEESGFELLVPLNLRRRRFSEHPFGLSGLHSA
jgi:hypothetical protein